MPKRLGSTSNSIPHSSALPAAHTEPEPEARSSSVVTPRTASNVRLPELSALYRGGHALQFTLGPVRLAAPFSLPRVSIPHLPNLPFPTPSLPALPGPIRELGAMIPCPDLRGGAVWMLDRGMGTLETLTRPPRRAARVMATRTAEVGGSVVDLNAFLKRAEHAFFSRDPNEDARDTAQLRALLRESLIACGKDPAERAASLRQVLVDHPETVEWIIQRRDMANFLESSDVELGDLRAEVHPFVQGLNSAIPGGECKDAGRNVLVRQGLTVPYKQLLRRLPDKFLLDVADYVNSRLEEFEFSKHPAVKVLLDPEQGIDFTEVPERIETLVETVLLPFFDELEATDKRRIAAAFLELEPFAPLSDKMSAVLLNLGQVAMLKLFQLVGKEAKSPLIQEAMKKLLQGLPKMPKEQVQRIIAKDLGCDVSQIDRIFPEFNYEKPLGVGTIGQVHPAKVRLDGALIDCVVKVLKPRLRPAIEREFATLFRLTKDPFVRELLVDAKASLLDEIDLTKEGENMRAALRAYQPPGRGIYPCRIIEGFEPTQNVLVMERAPGKVLADWSPEAGEIHPAEKAGIPVAQLLDVKRRALEELLKLTLVNYVWGEGERAMIYPDAHDGNMLLEPRRNEKPDYRLTIIDWGVVAKPDKRDQEGLKQIGTAVVIHSQPGGRLLPTTQIALGGLEKMAKLSDAQRDAFRKAAPGLMGGEGSYVKKIVDVLTWTIDEGVKLSAPCMQFNRARTFIEIGLEDVNEEMDQLDPEKKDSRLVRSSIDNVYQKCATIEVVKEWARKASNTALMLSGGMLVAGAGAVAGAAATYHYMTSNGLEGAPV